MKGKVKWKNKRCGDVTEADSMNADLEDEMGWNEVLKVWRGFIFRSMPDHRPGRQEMSSCEKLWE